ncbi:MAG: hypothetical protein ACTHMF_10095 [Leifsonia sp.]
MDHSIAPVLDALADYRRLDRYGFTRPGHTALDTIRVVRDVPHGG